MPPHPIDAYTWLTAAHSALMDNGLILSLQTHNDPHKDPTLTQSYRVQKYLNTRRQIIETILKALGPSEAFIVDKFKNPHNSLPILDLIHEIRIALDKECAKNNVSLVSDPIPDDTGKVGSCTLWGSTIRTRRQAREGDLRCMKRQCLVLVHIDCVA
jgi:hypothetical protein